MIPVLASAACSVAAAPAVVVPSAAARSEFRSAAFRKPDSFHWPGHMWIWNDRLDPAELKRQLADMAAHGALSPMPLPEPREFRPTNMPTRMEPGYLTPAFFDVIRAVADESRRLGMRLWLYDEGGWPSGNACGRLVRERPDLGRRSLKRAERTIAAGDSVPAPEDCLAAFVVGQDGAYRRLKSGEAATGAGSRLVTFAVARNGWHADLLDPAATDAFIAMTHEGYRKAAGSHFGTTIPAIFTDEPNMGDMPWTQGLAEAFLKDKGYDLLDRLPSLYGGESRADEQVRVDYFDWWSARFASAFFDRCRSWCRANGILFAGHLNGEDETLGARKHGFGSPMRMMRAMDIPGVDAIWRQLWPGKPNHHFPKFASSVAHQVGTDWAVTESFAVYGSGLTPEQMKWMVDYQFVRGINLLDMVGYPASISDWLIGGERPHYHQENPLWDVLPGFHAYVARLSYLLTLGKPRISVALHFPLRDIWAGGRNAQAIAEAHDRAAQALFERQTDFDLVDDDALGDATVQGGKLCVGPMAYDTVVLTRQSWMTDAARRRLEEFAREGGKLIVLDAPPSGAMPVGASYTTLAGLGALLRPSVAVAEPCPDLRVSVRDTDSGAIYFLTNEGMAPIAADITFPEGGSCTRLDPETGRTFRVPARASRGGTAVQLALDHAASVVLRVGTSARGTAAEPVEAGSTLCEIGGPWTVVPGRSFVLEPGAIRIERSPARDPVRSEGLPGSDALGRAFSGDAVYECRFSADDATAAAAAWLDLGDVRYACRVELNGRDLGVRLWRPWRVPVRGVVRRGPNTLRVVVTNTLANQYIHNRAYEAWTPAQLGPYHPRALEFERDSLEAGLKGPVRLLKRAD